MMEMVKGACRKRCGVHWVAFVLVIIGAINWGLVGAFDWNLVNTLFGGIPTVEMIIYILVGISGIVMIFDGMCKGCGCVCEMPAKPMEPKM
jgi:hypothetical protein